MARTPGGNGGDSSLIIFPTEHMRNVATQISVQAGLAQMQHDNQWQQLQNYVANNFDTSIQQSVLDCLKPYAARLRASYDWQVSLASAIYDAANKIDEADQQMAQSYDPAPVKGPR